MDHLNESTRCVLVVDGDMLLAEQLRTAMADHADVVLASAPGPVVYTQAVAWTRADQVAYDRRVAEQERERERAAWNDAVEAKRWARMQRRIDRWRSRGTS